MPSMSRRRSPWRRLLPIVVLLGELALPASALAQGDHRIVLVLYSTRRDSEFSTISEGELPRILDVGLARNLDYYSEFIDVARFPESAYKVAFGDFLRLKYQGVRIDLVIAMGDVAMEFVNTNRDSLFTETPVVFLANSRVTEGGANSTGLIVERDFSATLTLVEKLQPEVRNVFVVTGAAPADKDYENMVRAQAGPFESRLTFSYVSGLETTELERRLGSLPPRSIVYYLLVTEDGAGNKFHPLEYVDRVAAAANAPTYSWVDSTMDHGVVGGSLYTQREAATRIGQLALRVLRGERPDNIATSAVGLTVAQVDWRQLRRWGIDETRIPVGTLIRFREPSAWDRYKVYILAALAVLLLQSGLIAGLLIQRVRRRRVEAELRASQVELNTSYQRIRDLGGRLLHAQETERSRIARELHDDISQQASLLVIDLSLLRGAVQTETKNLTEEAFQRAEGIVKSVHDLSRRLHPAKLRLIGLVAALRDLQHEMTQVNVPITFTHDRAPATLPQDVTLCLFRVVQEALQNALKYSHAHQVSVHLNGSASELALTITDDGVGFDVKSAWGKGLGLVSIGERVEAIGGTVEILSKPGAGTRVEVRVPLSVERDKEPVAV
jgi:signal transduction histidine kinase